MADKALKRMTRRELLEMLVAQGKETAKLQNELDAARTELKNRRIKLEKAGSLAEAALALNGVFEAAEAAAAQYLENVHIDAAEGKAGRIEASENITADYAKAEAEAVQMIERAERRAKSIVAQAEAESNRKIAQADEYVHSVERMLQRLYRENPELREAIKKIAEQGV